MTLDSLQTPPQQLLQSSMSLSLSPLSCSGSSEDMTSSVAVHSTPTPHQLESDSSGYLCAHMDKINLRNDKYFNVINISQRSLSNNELDVLSKGLSFCPVPFEVNELKLKMDLDAYFRRLRLQKFFFTIVKMFPQVIFPVTNFENLQPGRPRVIEINSSNLTLLL